jgi:hypothetical protein
MEGLEMTKISVNWLVSSGVMVNMLALSAADRGFEHRTGKPNQRL